MDDYSHHYDEEYDVRDALEQGRDVGSGHVDHKRQDEALGARFLVILSCKCWE